MTGPRKPRPKKALTLVEMVADLDRRMEGGDPEAEVLLPAEDWEAIKRQAKEEEPSWSDLDPAEVDAAAREVAAFLSVLRWELVHVKQNHGAFRRIDAWLVKLGELREERITKSVTTQGECERIWAELGMADLDDSSMVEPEPQTPKKREVKAKGKPCPHCGEEGHEPDDCGLKPSAEVAEEATEVHPADCSTCAACPYLLRIAGKVLAGHYADRQTAVDVGRKLNQGDFEVIDASGKVWDLVGGSKTSKRKKKAPVQEEAPF